MLTEVTHIVTKVLRGAMAQAFSVDCPPTVDHQNIFTTKPIVSFHIAPPLQSPPIIHRMGG